MKLQAIVKELAKASESLGMQVRYEEGSFQSGLCQLEGREVIVLNKRHPVETHFNMLARTLSQFPTDHIYMKPAVRSALESAWGSNGNGKAPTPSNGAAIKS